MHDDNNNDSYGASMPEQPLKAKPESELELKSQPRTQPSPRPQLQSQSQSLTQPPQSQTQPSPTIQTPPSAPTVAPEQPTQESAKPKIDSKLIHKKIKTQRIINIIFGLIPSIGYATLNIVLHFVNINSGGFGWFFAVTIFPYMVVGGGICLVVALISLSRIIQLSYENHEQHKIRNIVIGIIAVLCTLSPFLISKIWVAVREHIITTSPYYSTYELNAHSCTDSTIKIRDGDEEYDYAIALKCAISNYYWSHQQEYPSEAYLQSFIANTYPDFAASYNYRLVFNSKTSPNYTDFVIQYGVDCDGHTDYADITLPESDGNYVNSVSIFSPLHQPYGESQKEDRFCINFDPDNYWEQENR